jgi:glucose-1-phosphate adenylyltransferase
VSLPEHTEIGYDTEADKKRFHVTESGIVVVIRQESLIEEPETP